MAQKPRPSAADQQPCRQIEVNLRLCCVPGIQFDDHFFLLALNLNQDDVLDADPLHTGATSPRDGDDDSSPLDTSPGHRERSSFPSDVTAPLNSHLKFNARGKETTNAFSSVSVIFDSRTLEVSDLRISLSIGSWKQSDRTFLTNCILEDPSLFHKSFWTELVSNQGWLGFREILPLRESAQEVWPGFSSWLKGWGQGQVTNAPPPIVLFKFPRILRMRSVLAARHLAPVPYFLTPDQGSRKSYYFSGSSTEPKSPFFRQHASSMGSALCGDIIACRQSELKKCRGEDGRPTGEICLRLRSLLAQNPAVFHCSQENYGSLLLCKETSGSATCFSAAKQQKAALTR